MTSIFSSIDSSESCESFSFCKWSISQMSEYFEHHYWAWLLKTIVIKCFHQLYLNCRPFHFHYSSVWSWRNGSAILDVNFALPFVVLLWFKWTAHRWVIQYHRIKTLSRCYYPTWTSSYQSAPHQDQQVILPLCHFESRDKSLFKRFEVTQNRIEDGQV